MQKFSKYFPWLVIILYFGLGAWVLMSDRFHSMQREFKIIFAVFLFLYGGYRMARIWTKSRERDDD